MNKTYKVVINTCFGGYLLSKKSIARLTELGVVYDSEYDYSYDMKRHDPLLVQVVEELRGEAGADHSKLTVGEISSPSYIIQEYDGRETIVTPEDIKWIKIE